MCVSCVWCIPQDEISELKRKFKIMSHQIEQLKEEIAAKDLALVKEHFDHMKVCRACFTRRPTLTALPAHVVSEVDPVTVTVGGTHLCTPVSPGQAMTACSTYAFAG